MSDAQTIGEAVRSANKELTAKPEGGDKPERTEHRETRQEQAKETVKTDDDFGAPKWTQQWKKPTREALRKLYANEEAKGLLPDILKEVEERYDYSGKTQADLDRYRKRYDPYNDVLGSLEQRFAVQGMHPAAGLQQMAAVSDMLQRDPDQALTWLAQNFRPRDVQKFVQTLAQNYGVDLGELAAQAPWVDLEVQKLVAPLQQQNQRLMGMMQNFHQQQFQAGAQQIAHHLKAFREATDESGNPKYPHLNRVEPIMAQIITATGITDLDLLYKKAIRLDDELFEQVKEDDARRAENRAIKDAAAQNANVEEAKRASRNVNGVTTAPAKQKPMSIREAAIAASKRLSNM